MNDVNAPAKNHPQNNGRKNYKQLTNEFCSWHNKFTFNSYYFGLDVLDSYSPETLKNIVKDPMTNNELLRKLSIMLYGTSGTYTNVVDYMTSLPTLDKVVVTHGKNDKRKQTNKERMLSTLRTIKDKEIIRDALMKGMLEGVAFYYFETTKMPISNQKMLTDYDVDSVVEINELGINASVISLPVDYTRIVGRQNSNYVIAFNLDYFDIATGETVERKLRKFPKEIRDAYNRRKSGNTNGNWVVLDNKKTIVHKIRSEISEPYGRPLVLAAIPDILYRDYFTNTKRNILDELNNKIIYQTFPEGKDKGTSALTKQQQQVQHDSVKSAVMNKNNRGGVSFFSVASGTKISSIDTANTDIFDEKNEANLDNKIALALGFAGNALSGSGSGSYSSQESNLELVTSQIFQWVEQIENEINKCINANVIQDARNWCEVKYLPITHLNKKSMVNYAKDLYLQGCGSLSLWAASCGISPDAFYALLDEEIANGIYDKYKPHQTSYTLSSNGKSAGRPMTDDPSESTVESRANNGNDIPSPSDNR